ncbi:hypothetical protein [Snodgrassella sp. CFCC 13594]|uniref:hypothetical protein n=1 Tax=Snodgrassella sp. CFCC 13594 TaxID=1775559 RepID=UPI000836974D|nr:hypothetical protein [Snodgrassella sp. CFCC 13594]
MNKARILLCIFCLTFAFSAFAARIIPTNMQVAVLKSASGNQVVLGNDKWSWLKVLTLGWLDGSKAYDLNASVRVRNQNNLFVTYGQLPRFAGEAVAVRFNTANSGIDEIWILTPQEREQLAQRAERMRARMQQLQNQ